MPLDDQPPAIVKAIVTRGPPAGRVAANLHLSLVQTSLRQGAAPAARKPAAVDGKAKVR